MARSWDLTAVGDINADLIMSEPAAPPALGQEVLVKDAFLTIGGSTSLLSSTAARLGLAVRIVGKIGDDDLGRTLRGELEAAGVDTSLVMVDPAVRTGITVSLTYPHDRALVTYSGPIARLAAEEIPDAAFEHTRHFHVSSYYLQTALQPGCAGLLRRAREHGMTTSLDTGDDPDDRWDSGLAAVLPEVDVFLPNRREALQISDEGNQVAALDRLAATVPNVLVKLGPDGAIGVVRGQRLSIAAYNVRAVDTTGAGDAFGAGFLRAYLRGLSNEDCFRWAAASGALTTTWLGGQNDAMTESAVAEMVEAGRATVPVVPLEE
jgi:sugar/nucleoside kinase (ribokinase family)